VNIVKNNNGLTLKNFMHLPSFVVNGIKFNAAGMLYTPKPIISSVIVTHRCNSRCIMCIFWKENNCPQDMTAEQIGNIYKDPLFSSLERLTLSGGEATLRDDLVDIADNILNSCQRIKEISLCTNGLDTDRVVDRVEKLLKLTRSRKVGKFSISTSIDGIGSLHETIRRVPQAFIKIDKTICELHKLQKIYPFYLSATCVVQPLNMLHLTDVLEYGHDHSLPLTFVPVCTSNTFTDKDTQRDRLQFSEKAKEELQNIFASRLMPHLSPPNKLFWREYFKINKGYQRHIPCFLLNHFAVVDYDGKMRICTADNSFALGSVKEKTPSEIWFSPQTKKLRRRIKAETCVKCTIHCDEAYSLSREFFYYARYLCINKWHDLIKTRGI
jgi:MoaA/NifB/PqqE/SkfB family radical SAM enzyme